MPHSMDQFKTLRPKDINLEIPISDIEEELTFFMFNQPYLNTFDSSLLNEHLNYPGIKLEKEIKLKTKRLETILDEYLSKLNSSKIDFFSIDVEGWDLRVLKSNNWELYRPEYILVEELFTNIIETLDGEIANYLKTVGYQLIAKTNETSFYKRN